MKLKPRRDLMVIEPIKMENVTSEGVIIPGATEDGEGDTFVVGKVHAIGPGEQLTSGEFQDLGIEPGDYIIYAENAPLFALKTSPIARLDGSKMLPKLGLMHARHAMAVIDAFDGELIEQEVVLEA